MPTLEVTSSRVCVVRAPYTVTEPSITGSDPPLSSFASVTVSSPVW